MYDDCIIPYLRDLPCNDCDITINTKDSTEARPHGYKIKVDDFEFSLRNLDECRTLLQKLEKLNDPKIFNVIAKLKKKIKV
jgi:hypothetical protein